MRHLIKLKLLKLSRRSATPLAYFFPPRLTVELRLSASLQRVICTALDLSTNLGG